MADRKPAANTIPESRPSGIWLPAGTPKEVVARMNELFVTALARPKAKEYLFNAGSVPFPTTSDQLMKFQIAEHDKWRKVIHAAGLQPE